MVLQWDLICILGAVLPTRLLGVPSCATFNYIILNVNHYPRTTCQWKLLRGSNIPTKLRDALASGQSNYPEEEERNHGF